MKSSSVKPRRQSKSAGRDNFLPIVCRFKLSPIESPHLNHSSIEQSSLHLTAHFIICHTRPLQHCFPIVPRPARTSSTKRSDTSSRDHVPPTRRAPGPRRQWRPHKRQRHCQRRPRGLPVRSHMRHCESAEQEMDTPLTSSRSAIKTDQSKKVQSSNPYAPVGDFLSNVR